MSPATRVRVFVDYQNVYMGARQTFGHPNDPTQVGQIHPRRLGILLTERGRAVDPRRELDRVCVFSGEPSPVHSPRGQAACDRKVRS
jgi:hypothetical protein